MGPKKRKKRKKEKEKARLTQPDHFPNDQQMVSIDG
jgi:hypothetical protein